MRGSTSLLEDGDPDVWMLPTLSYGRSLEHVGFAGTVTLSTETLLHVCRDVGRSVAASGFRRLVFVNGHGGNVALLDVVARDIRAETGLIVFRIMPRTSVLPEGLVPRRRVRRPRRLRGDLSDARPRRVVGPPRPGGAGRSLGRRLFGAQANGPTGLPVSTAWLTGDLSRNGVIGDPRAASAEIWQAHRRGVAAKARRLLPADRRLRVRFITTRQRLTTVEAAMLREPKITAMGAREVLDCRGLPTVQVDVVLDDAFLGRADVPAGRSRGRHEPVEIRDGGRRYGGFGVRRAVANVRDVLAPALIGSCAVAAAIARRATRRAGRDARTGAGSGPTPFSGVLRPRPEPWLPRAACRSTGT